MNFSIDAPDKTTIFIIVGVIAFVVFCGIAVFIYREFQSRFNGSAYETCTDEEFEHIHLEPNYLLKLHYLLHVSNEILKRAKVQYVTISGTLLSIFRTGFLTPWDDDGDLNVYKPDFQRNKLHIDQLMKQYGVYLNDPFWMAKLEIFQLKLVDGHPMQQKYPSEKEPFVDWVLYEKMTKEVSEQYQDHEGRAVYHFSSPRERELFPREFLFEDEIYPIEEAPLTAFSAATAKRLGVENPTVTLRVPKNASHY